MIYLKFHHIVQMNEHVTRVRGLLRDAGSLQAACGRPAATAFGEDAYPTIYEKAAALMQSIARDHPFNDGNKRTAWMAATTLMDVNGHPLDLDFDEDAGDALVMAVALGEIRDVPTIASELVKFTIR